MNILIVDDHPLTVSVYSDIIKERLPGASTIVPAYNCTDAYNVLAEFKDTGSLIDLAIIDYNLPPCGEQNILNGSDFATLLQKTFSNCKVIMITSHTEVLIIYDILRKINPEGLVSKNDVDIANFPDIIKSVINGKIYKSEQIVRCIEEVWSHDAIVDEYNRKILLHLAKGYKIKELENVIMLSKSAIQKRILKLRKAFNAEDERELMKRIFEENYL